MFDLGDTCPAAGVQRDTREHLGRLRPTGRPPGADRKR
jgi:hypothetical protein